MKPTLFCGRCRLRPDAELTIELVPFRAEGFATTAARGTRRVTQAAGAVLAWDAAPLALSAALWILVRTFSLSEKKKKRLSPVVGSHGV